MGEETAETFTIAKPPICYNNLGEKVNFLQNTQIPRLPPEWQ